MNPMDLLQLKGALASFQQNHPKFAPFLKAVYQNGLAEGSVIEISVKTPQNTEYTTNMRLTASDLELLRQLREMAAR